MDLTLKISLICGIIIYFIILMYLLKKDTLLLKYTLLWLFTGIVMLLIVLFPGIIQTPLEMLGIVEWTNGVFALLILFLIIICVSITAIVSKLNEKNKTLIQQCALYEERIRKLEEKLQEPEEGRKH